MMVYDVVLELDGQRNVIGTYKTSRKAHEVFDIVERVRPQFGLVMIVCRNEEVCDG